MNSTKRRTQIIELVNARGFATVRELSEAMRVSEVTIRRDLQSLQEDQQLSRQFGGAVPAATRHQNWTRYQGSHIDPTLPEEAFGEEADATLELVDHGLRFRILQSTTGPGQAFETATRGALEELAAAIADWASRHGGDTCRILLLASEESGLSQLLLHLQESISTWPAGCEIALTLPAADVSSELLGEILNDDRTINLIFAEDATALPLASEGARSAGRSREDLLLVMANAYCEDTHLDSEPAISTAGLYISPAQTAQYCLSALQGDAQDQEQPTSPIQEPTAYVLRSGDSMCQGVAHTSPTENTNSKPLAQTRFRLSVVCDPEHPWDAAFLSTISAAGPAYGFAIRGVATEVSSRQRDAERTRMVADRAASLIAPGTVLLLSHGRISLELAKVLLEARDLTVITNSLDVFEILLENPHIHVISTGGETRLPHRSLVGSIAQAALREIRADKFFLEPSGIAGDLKLYHGNIAEVPVLQQMIRAARELIVIATSDRFHREGVVAIDSIGIADRVVTDNEISAEVRVALLKMGVQLHGQ